MLSSLHSLLKTSAMFVRILEQVKTDLLSNSPKRSPRFSPGYEGTENMFYFLNITELNDINLLFVMTNVDLLI